MSLLVKLNNVSKLYRNGSNQYSVLKNIYFELKREEMLAIVGASGSGKTTLMNILGFLDQPSEGQYFFLGEEVSKLDEDALAEIRNQKIGFVFQSFFLLPRLNVLQNVMLPLFYRDENKKIAQQKALQMLAKVKMEKFRNHKPNQLSGGQQQRVAIARALVADPEIILADEPTGSLDSKTGQDVMDLFIDLNQNEKRTIILITHDQHISRQCLRVVSLSDGKILSDAV